MNELPNSAKLARKALKIIMLPLGLLAVAVRFTVMPSTYWIDGVFIVLGLIAVVLAVTGRVFASSKPETDGK